MKNFQRHYRIASLLREALAPMLAAAVRDGLVTLRHIDLNNDFSVATVVYTVIGCDRAGAQRRLEEAAFACRKRLARRLNMRKTPRLVFHHDDEGLAADDMRRFLEGIAADE